MSQDKTSEAARRRNRAVLLVLIGHTIVANVTWRDIRQRPARQVRGSKTLWRALSALNTLGSVGYWLIGRRCGRSQPG
jgi:hypothetical protein